MHTHLVLTIITEDQPGILEKISAQVSDLGGNWLESSMINLAGKFAGVALVEIAEDRHAELSIALQDLKASGIRVTVEASRPEYEIKTGEPILLKIVANDRPGIVQEFSHLLASLNVNIEALDTYCESAAMSSDQLFEATATVVLPEGMDADDLVTHLETLSDDLMVEFVDLDD